MIEIVENVINESYHTALFSHRSLSDIKYICFALIGE